MTGYWIRHRSIFTILLCAALAFVAVFLFVYPYITQRAGIYNSQSIYKNTNISFIAPEPSFDQVKELPGTNGIERIFPFYLTKTPVNINGATRTTTVLLSDQFQSADDTMFNEKRLIERSKTAYEHPILVDWQFCHDTSAKLGDTVTFAIAGENMEYQIYAIYETNSIYDGGAVLAQISETDKEAIKQRSNNNGYSGMYIVANDYSACQRYLTTDYRPLGRLKNRDQFDDESQYQLHYDAIMSSGYANEITDFRVKESAEKEVKPLLVCVGAALSGMVFIIFNVIMAKRGCEKVYFQKNCIPKGQNVKPYYSVSFILECILFIVCFVTGMIVKISSADIYIPKTIFDIWVVVIPLAVIVAEVICLIINYATVAVIAKKVRREK